MALTPVDGVRALRGERRSPAAEPPHHRATDATSPTGSCRPTGGGVGKGVVAEYRHYQEIIDALGRSLSLVTAPDSAHTRGSRPKRGIWAPQSPVDPDDVPLLDEVPRRSARAGVPATVDRGRDRRRAR